MGGFTQFVPEAALLVPVPVALLLGSRLRERWIAWLAMISCGVAGVSAWYAPTMLDQASAVTTTLDTTAGAARLAICVLAALWLAWVAARGAGAERSGEAVGLALLSTLGGLLLASATDLVVAFVAMELTVLPAYVLLGYSRHDVPVLKGVLKQMTRSALASMIALYGISFLYGLTGATSFEGIATSLPEAGPLGATGAILAVGGLLARLTLLYRCASARSGVAGSSVFTAFVASVPAFSMSVFLAQFLSQALTVRSLQTILVAGAVFCLAVGLYVIVREQEPRELLAGAGTVHIGFLMAGLAVLVAASPGSSIDAVPVQVSQLAVVAPRVDALVIYAFTYSIAALALGLLLAGTEGEGPRYGRRLAMRAAAVLLASLAGVPPLAGFAGRWLLLRSVHEAGFGWLVATGVAVSIVSAWYVVRAALSRAGSAEAQATAEEERITGSGPGGWLSEDRLSLSLAVSAVLVGGAVLWVFWF